MGRKVRIRWALSAVAIISLIAVVGIVLLRSRPSPEVQQCLEHSATQVQHLSPNGHFSATDIGEIVDKPGNDCIAVQSMLITRKFMGWTTDSRFALFNMGDQYGNRVGIAFDVQAWQFVQLYALSPQANTLQGGMSGTYRLGIANVDLSASRVVLEDGTVITLPYTVEGITPVQQSLPKP